ncbi:flocculation protein FLO11 [Ricinus communis]|uniref:ATP binding protein n=1 Tax=Ricinus communis TaxID=3988 RepID=B9RMM4_RICCO|nr:flocculation protein FLO11 [Ricinus communis]EEF47547.1 conserved hypothetical protein [Ricinus communis]|eukprot:XP_002514993.1 flocculation protein FLO11 [Ricinus communis]
MPPSPALRYSPGRDPRAEIHKRGRSLEGGLLFKEKDDDLALFNEMQSRERENFLLQSSDDLEDTFSSKLRHFSDFKLGISIPVRGESSELLNADGEKNDYDWLLTPPDTPLFPSLDDEPPPVNVASRGRPRSQPITISRSSTMEKSYRSSRGSASPNRLSPSPRSGNSSFQSRGRPSSAPHSSPTQTQRPATPSRRPSPPPSKVSTPAPRSSTPTPSRTSTGSGGRGVSPVRTSRGNSASPKIRAWQSNIPGFSSEAPPNLRTSLADRPASYVRGSSPASRNGRESTSKFGRQSMSPTATRSVSSSQSQDRDRISSRSRGSVASSGDDDVDSLQSIHVGSLDKLASKKTGTFINNRAVAFSKKSTRILSPSSAPKRSFDSALRQMDHRKSPQNMFRPLLSSVPSSTFYVGQGVSAHRPLISRNSSVTTSSNASSDQGTSIAHDTEGSDHHQDDTVIESGKTTYSDAQEEVFAFDKVDALNKDVEHETDDGPLHFQSGDSDRNPAIEYEPNDSEEFSHQEIDMEISSASEILCVKADFSEVDSHENAKICSKCGSRYCAIEMVERDINLCPDCSGQDNLMAVTSPETTVVTTENCSILSLNISEECKPFDEPPTQLPMPESQSKVSDEVEARITQQEDNVKHGQTSYKEQSDSFSPDSSLARLLVEGDEQRIANQHGAGQPAGNHRRSDSESGGHQLMRSNDYRSHKMDVSEGAGISVLLKRSSSSKGPVVQARTFVASTITYDDFSYTRDSANSLRSSIGHGSTSASSSIDFGSARHVENRVQRQLSGRKSDIENYRYERPQSTGSSFSGTLSHTHRALGLVTSTHEENSEAFVGDMRQDGLEGEIVTSCGKFVASENKDLGAPNESFSDAIVYEEGSREPNESYRLTDAATSGFACRSDSIHLDGSSEASFPNYDYCHSHENEDDFPNNAGSVSDVEASVISPDPNIELEHTMLNTSHDGLNDAGVPTHSSLASISEIETENFGQSTSGSENDDVSANSKSNSVNEFQDISVPTPPDKDASDSVLEQENSDHIQGIFEDSTVMVHGGSKARSLTLEEATDTILFCSSIVHDLAYQAATIAIEKEDSGPLEVSRPTVTILGKSTADRKDSRSRTSGKRTSKPLKVKQKRMELDVKSPSSKTENDENANEPMVRNVGLPNNMDSSKPPKLESKCNCTIM